MKFISKSLEETKSIAEMFSNNIFSFSNILLFWEVWTWKTHFTKFLLDKLWVKWQIKSPTYSFSNFYEVKNSCNLKSTAPCHIEPTSSCHIEPVEIWNNKNPSTNSGWQLIKNISSIWHYDIYRLKKGENLELIDEHFFWNELVICEWAEKLQNKPENRIEITFKKISENEREISFEFIWTSLNDIQIKRLYNFYKTPEHVKKHIAVVTNVAINISENLIKKWILVDKWLVSTSAKLHDLVRYVDFQWWVIKEKIPYEVDDETIKFWKDFSEKCKWIHHADVAHDILDDLWYPEVWKVIEAHKNHQIFKWFRTIEEKIVYYSDKRALHDKLVNIEERIKDWKKRYWKEWNDDYRNRLKKKLSILEKELIVKV